LPLYIRVKSHFLDHQIESEEFHHHQQVFHSFLITNEETEGRIGLVNNYTSNIVYILYTIIITICVYIIYYNYNNLEHDIDAHVFSSTCLYTIIITIVGRC
jgi:hypothetical protein